MPRIQRHNRRKSVYASAMDRFERELIEQYLARFDGVMRDTADALGIALQTLYYRCRLLKVGPYAQGAKRA